MKKIFFLLLAVLLTGTAVHAQKRTFMRFYSLAGNKFQKGYFAGTTDSSVFIYKQEDTVEVSATDIGYIKTKRSFGHNVLAGTLAGAIPLSIVGAIAGEPHENNNTFGGVLHDAVTPTPGEGAIGGLMVGGIAGAVTGALTSAFRKSITFTINGRLADWQTQKKIIDLLPAGK